ncbi:MAG: site-specific integrase [Nitrosomonas sp.]|nr:site-specific integrase [Nitrosomonas sp.]
MVSRKGVRKSQTFRTKAQAAMWAADVERDILAGKYSTGPDRPFADLLRKYASVVSPTKRGCRWEVLRIESICRDVIGSVMLSDLRPVHFAEYRDRRLVDVTAATVRREWNLLSHALNVAINEWGWITDNPLKSVKRPAPPPPRDRRLSENEIERLLFALGYDYGSKPETVTARVGAAMLFAIETAMRTGEICKLSWHDVDLDKRVAHLPKTKNGFARVVPLSAEAVRIVDQVRIDESESVFNLRTSQIDALFRKAKSRALIGDLHFHDTRAEATTRLSAKVDILTLARITGHRDLKMLQVYYRESMEDVAKRI